MSHAKFGNKKANFITMHQNLYANKTQVTKKEQ